MLDYLDDIASDMSVFHRVDEIGALEARVFFAFARRLSAYSGVMAARQAAETAPSRPREVSPAAAGVAAPRREVTPGSRASLMADPAFRGHFSFGTGSSGGG